MDNEQEQKDVLKEYMKVSQEALKRKKWKRIIIIIFMIIFGPYLIYLFYNLPTISNIIARLNPKYLPYFNVQLNDHEMNVYEKIPSTIIIPNKIEIDNGQEASFSVKNEGISFAKQEPFILKIKTYTCFIDAKKKTKVSCGLLHNFKDFMKENNAIVYQKMTIMKYSYNPKYEYSLSDRGLFEVGIVDSPEVHMELVKNPVYLYSGSLFTNITPYINNEGIYVIKIDFKNKKDNGSFLFGIINYDEYFYRLPVYYAFPKM